MEMDFSIYPLVNSLLLNMAQSKWREFSDEKHGDFPLRYVNIY